MILDVLILLLKKGVSVKFYRLIISIFILDWQFHCGYINRRVWTHQSETHIKLFHLTFPHFSWFSSALSHVERASGKQENNLLYHQNTETHASEQLKHNDGVKWQAEAEEVDSSTERQENSTLHAYFSLLIRSDASHNFRMRMKNFTLDKLWLKKLET